MESQTYTLEEVAKHNTKTDCWIIIGDNVCDVTKFIDEHPGGEFCLLNNAGKDATEAFRDVGHSDNAKELIKKYFIGKLV